jgi:chorismate-pyruvate lyase
VNSARWATPDLQSLVDLFYPDPSQLGQFEEKPYDLIPPECRALLAHDSHMTVTLEEYHQSKVSVEVLEFQRTTTHYSRKIILRKMTDNVPVLFGIVRLSLNFLPPHVQEEIEARKTPLGRVLIQNEILRTVKLLSLWEINPGTDLSVLFGGGRQNHPACFGRTALIYCDGLPAVELLEIAQI